MIRTRRIIHSHRTAMAGVIAASLALVASPAFSDSAVSLGSAANPTEVSGFAGSAFTLGTPNGVQGLTGLWSVERGDKPCYVASMTEDVNNSGTDSGAIKNLCGDNATSSEMKAQFTDSGFAKRTFVRALRVCMNKDNDRVKGVQIRGREVDSSGNVSDLPARYPDSSGSSGMSALTDLNAPSDERANCNTWKKWVECPDGQIATAVIAHFGAGSTPRSLTGVALQCRVVVKGG